MPALSVLGIVCALARSQWDGPFTRGVFCVLITTSVAVMLFWAMRVFVDAIRTYVAWLRCWPAAVIRYLNWMQTKIQEAALVAMFDRRSSGGCEFEIARPTNSIVVV